MAEVAYGSLPFAEQIAFFRRKLNVNTERWTDVWQEAHDRAFMVAGANRDDLVADFRAAIDRAISQGATLAQFRKEFDRVVEKYGWSYNGGRNWRSRVIYETNLRASYAAGRWAQLQEEKKWAPYWEYVHSDAVEHPRPLHVSWHGLILDADDPWWLTHYPPNGWGCQCSVRSRSARELKRMGKTGPDKAPDDGSEVVTVGKRGPAPFDVETPVGVDPGFGYAPGRSAFDAWLKPQAEAAERAAAGVVEGAWLPLAGRGPADYGRPERIPFFPAPVEIGPLIDTVAELVASITEQLGSGRRVFNVRGVLPVMMDAQLLGAHIAKDPGRSRYLPLLLDLLDDPWEVWQVLERHDLTGAVRTRARIIKGYELDKGRSLLLVADRRGGMFTSWTFVQVSDLKYANRQRLGVLLYGAD